MNALLHWRIRRLAIVYVLSLGIFSVRHSVVFGSLGWHGTSTIRFNRVTYALFGRSQSGRLVHI